MECEVDLQCKNCEYLKLLLEQERHDKRQILALLLDAQNKSAANDDEPPDDNIPIKTGYVSGRVRIQQLEAASRKRAAEARDKEAKKEIN